MLPFIAGIATGIIGVIAYKNKDRIKQTVQDNAKIAQKFAQDRFEQSKEFATDIKNKIESKKTDTSCCPHSNKETNKEENHDR